MTSFLLRGGVIFSTGTSLNTMMTEDEPKDSDVRWEAKRKWSKEKKSKQPMAVDYNFKQIFCLQYIVVLYPVLQIT